MIRHPGSRLRVGITFVASVALIATLLTAPTSTALSAACQVKNLDTGVTKPSLQEAVDSAAQAGHHLVVRGTCVGITTIGKSLSIRGVEASGSGAPSLDGVFLGTVVTVMPGARVTIRELTIRRGSAQSGGGIHNSGTLILRDVIVRANSATDGGGAFNDGTIRMVGSSAIRANSASQHAGGVLNQGTLVMKDSSVIERNIAAGGSGGVDNRGILRLNGSSAIRANKAQFGGGIYTSIGTVVMNDSSRIIRNTANYGGGLLIDSMGTLVMKASSLVVRNTAYDPSGGGGLYVMPNGTLIGVTCAATTLEPAIFLNVRDNTPDNCYFLGP
jgi:hypothetical protein